MAVYKTMELTQKQETFVLNLFKGMSQREAYIAAGYSPKQLPATIDRHACELAKNDKIVTRWRELRQTTEATTILSVIERKQRLSDIASEDNTGQYGYARQPNISAITELNKMEKVYEPDYSQEVKVQTFVFILPDGTKVAPKELMSGD